MRFFNGTIKEGQTRTMNYGAKQQFSLFFHPSSHPPLVDHDHRCFTPIKWSILHSDPELGAE